MALRSLSIGSQAVASPTGIGSVYQTVFDARSYGAKGDGQTLLDGAMTASSAVLTSESNLFTVSDVGKPIQVAGAGASGTVLQATITSYQSAGQVTLTATASTTVTGAMVTWGSDDTTALTAFVNALQSGTTRRGFLPDGIYMVSSLPQITQTINLEGGGNAGTQLCHTGTGILLTVNNVNSMGLYGRLGSTISRLNLLAGPGTSILFQVVGTWNGRFSQITAEGNFVPKAVGIEVRDSVSPNAGAYYNLFENCSAFHCGTNWRVMSYRDYLQTYANNNTFLNCRSVSGQWGGTTWAATTAYTAGAVVVPTTANFGGRLGSKVFVCTTPGTSGSSEPTWTTATLLGNTVTDGGVTWTRVNWDDVTNVPSPGCGWLVSNAQGNTWIGGDVESCGGYAYIFTHTSASYSRVYGTWIEGNGQQLPGGTRGSLFDNASTSSSGSVSPSIHFYAVADTTGLDDGLSWVGPGSQVRATGNDLWMGQTILRWGPNDGSNAAGWDIALSRLGTSQLGLGPFQAFVPGTHTANPSGTWSAGAEIYNTTAKRLLVNDGAAWGPVDAGKVNALGTQANGTTVTPDLATATYFTLTASGATLTIANPTNALTGTRFCLDITNSSGGTLTITWGANYVQNFTPPATGNRAVAVFVYDGTNYVQHGGKLQLGDIPSGVAQIAQPNTWSAAQVIAPASASGIPVTVKGFATQTADLQEWQDSNAFVAGKVDAYGNLSLPVAALPGAPTIGAAAGAGNLTGTYTWAVTLVSQAGLESSIGTATAAQTLTTQSQTLTMPAAASVPRGSTFSLYRIKNGGTTYFRVSTGLNPGATVTDNTADGSLTIAAPNVNSAAALLSVQDITARRLILSQGPTPTVAAGSANGGSPPSPILQAGATDQRGRVTFGSGTTPTQGAQVVVAFGGVYGAAPQAVLVNWTGASQALGACSSGSVTAAGFTAYSGAAPAASQSSSVYSLYYVVIW